MFNTVRQWFKAVRLARQRLRYQKTAEWTPADAQAWTAFLRTPAGAKIDLLLVNLVLDTMQESASRGGSAFDSGVAHGARTTWTHLRMLSATGVTPEDDSNIE
jgi:hypothetical protein